MAVSPLAMRIIASSIIIANRAGSIIREVMNNGDLGIVDKVLKLSNFQNAQLISKYKSGLRVFFVGQRRFTNGSRSIGTTMYCRLIDPSISKC